MSTYLSLLTVEVPVNYTREFRKHFEAILRQSISFMHKMSDTFPIFHVFLKYFYKKVKGTRYRPGVAQRVGRGIALLFHDRGTRRG